MRLIAIPLICILTAALGACSVYHPLHDGVGFTDVPVGPDSYDITYSGPMNMTIAAARKYALLRASELAILHDDPYFEILREQDYLGYGEQYVPGTDYAYVGGRHRHHYVYHVYSPGYVEPYTVPEATMSVRVLGQANSKSIPALTLIERAQAEKTKLSPGVAEHAAAMTSGISRGIAPTPATLAPPMRTTTQPAPATGYTPAQ